MSWNDQGNNNGSRDPWGRNNNPPPDIDELIKKFRAQINSIFGGWPPIVIHESAQ